MRFRTIAVGITLATATTQAAFATSATAADAPTVTVERGVVVVTGTAVRDVIIVSMDATGLVVDFGADGTPDVQIERSRYQAVRILAGAGDDGVSALGVGDVPVTVAGEAGDDAVSAVGNIGETGTDDAATVLSGDNGNDRLLAATPGPITVLGGAGDDTVDGSGGGIGQQNVSLGDGNDRFISSLNAFLGDRRDTVDGGNGRDILEVEGTFASESVSFSARKGRLVVDHDLRNQVVADNVEDVSYLGFGSVDDSGSGDAVAVNDLSGTDVVRFTANFSTGRDRTEPNGSADTLTVRGTPGVDHITVSGAKADVLVSGLTPVVAAVFLQPQDFLLIDTLAGNDVVDSSGLQPGLVQLLVR
jgi:hypothetical protein